MKDLDLGALFCEVTSGLAAALVVLAVWDWLSPEHASRMVEWIWLNHSLGLLTTVLLLAYVLGLVVDAVGLLFDALVVANVKWFGLETTPAATAFRMKASAHVFSYWKEQWAYYSCYRNLLMALLVGVVPSARASSHYGGTPALVAALAVAAILFVALAYCMRTLLGIYNGIERSFDAAV
jgi:hypothetical protein